MTQTEILKTVEILTHSSPKETRRWQSGRRWLIAAVVVVAVIGVLAFEIRSRVKAATDLRAVTFQLAVPSVSVVLPKQTAPAQEVVLPAICNLTSPLQSTREPMGTLRSGISTSEHT
jgi:hypothetical protein